MRAVEAHGAWVQVWPVDSTRLLGWLRARARSLGLEASEEALELLAARTEGNLLAAHQELAKLALLGAGPQMSAAAVQASVADSARFDVFQLGGGGARRGDDARAAHARRVARGGHRGDARAVGAHQGAARRLDARRRVRAAGRQPWQRQSAALAKAVRRAPRLCFGDLVQRAGRADRMIKGRLTGNAWDEMALLAVELCAQPAGPRLALAR